MLARLNARALGFLCDRGHRTLLLSERYAQPGRDYADALEWVRTIEPPMPNTRGRVPDSVRIERAAERRAA